MNKIHTKKLKRKRTGGKLGSFKLTLDWKRKRYVQDDGYMPCDPELANSKLKQVLRGATTNSGYLPYKDDNGDGVTF